MSDPTSPDVDRGAADGVFAAIDVGTNSFHLVVARAGGDERFEVITRQKEMVRLGAGPSEMKRLAPDAIDRGVVALARLREMADGHGAALRAVATSAVREALNRDEFLERARREAGVVVEVVSGIEEARLIHLGVLQSVPVYDQRHFVCDIGGGSTELVVADGEEVLAARSFKLGAIRLTDRFFPGERLVPGAVHACRRYVRATFTPFASEVAELAPITMVASSGTAAALCRVAAALGDAEAPTSMGGFRLERSDLDRAVEALSSVWTVSERREVPGLDAERADIILGGALVLEQVMDRFGMDHLVFSDGALREGVLLDTWRRLHGGSLHHLSDLRRRSVEHLQRACDPDPTHSATVARHALALFDATSELHGLGDDARELLEAGALLANVGLVVAHSAHHRHSYYVIRNSEHLSGFTDREVELIALVARYHRKSQPKRKHREFEALADEDRRVVRVLAGLLRVAVGLDRHHAARVTALDVSIDDDAVVITVVPSEGHSAGLEVYEAAERSALLASVLGREVHVEAVGSDDSTTQREGSVTQSA